MLGFLHRTSSDASSLKQKPTVAMAPERTPTTNGNSSARKTDHLNGFTSPRARPVTPSRNASNLSVGKRLTRSFLSATGLNSRFFGGQIKEQHAIVRRRAQNELGAHVGAFVFDTSFAGLLEWIRSERLTRVPHKGGHWDRVLIKVQHFAQQVHDLTRAIEVFAEECVPASHLIFGHCLLLLELGYENASALEKAFHLFYQFGLELLPLLRCVDMFGSTPVISEAVSNIFSDLLNVVTAVAVTFHNAVHGGRESTTIDVYRSFASQIELFHTHVSKTTYAMWSFSLIGDDEAEQERLQVLQKRLSPQDSVLAFLAAKHINIATRPEQFTCNWFQSHITNFIRSEDRILLVEGKSGSGKTTLANWTLDRLQRPINRRTVTTISFFFNASIAGQNSGLALVKTLLYQLLFQRIGDTALFKALDEAVTKSLFLQPAEEQENRLWLALNKALSHLTESEDDALVIVVDGVDGIAGQKAEAQKTSQRLYDLAKKIPAVRLIKFSQSIDMSHPKFSRHVELTPEILNNDMATVTRRNLLRHPHFKGLNEPDQERVIDRLVDAAGTSILWLSLACRYFNLQHQPFDKSLETLLPKEKPLTVPDVVLKILSSITLDQDAKHALTYVLTSERPLLFDEIRLLLQAQPDRFSIFQRTIDLEKTIKSIAPFVLVTEGLVAIRHNAIKQALGGETNTSKVLAPRPDRQKDILLRSLIYAKTCLLAEHQTSLDSLEIHQIDNKLRGASLLEYTVRYWTTHFKKTSHYKPSGTLALPKDFNSIFPESVLFVLLEEGCWTNQLSPLEAIDLHITAYRVREAIYGQDHPCVLQNAITIAKLYENLLSRTTDAVEWYVKAMKICFKLFGTHSEMTVTLCHLILRITEKHVVTKRNTIMEWREEVMLTLITIYVQRFGASSKEVIEIREQLIELYISIQEEHKCKEHREAIDIILRGGRSGVSVEGNVNLDGSTTLVKHKPKEEIDVFEGAFLGGYIAEGVEIVLTFDMVEQIILLIRGHIEARQFEKAEELYIELWLKLTEYCQTHREVEWHSKKIEIMIAYSRFLHTHNRSSESSAILLCIWKEYEHHEMSSFETINILLKEVAVFMKVFGLLTTSLAIFRKCWSWFKHAHKEHTAIFKEIESSITTISTEIVKTSNTTTTSETIVREIFESSLSSTETITTTTIELCRTLSSTYIREERYSEAIVCIESTLRRSWSSFFFESDVSILMSAEMTSHNIELVMQLAQCYLHQKRYEKVEEIYIRLYRVYRKTHSIDHELVIKYTEKILAFYREHGMFHKAISFYQELLVEYRLHYSAHHSITIKTLYALGDLCRQHHLTHSYWIEYYLEIVNVLNKGSLYCHEEALRALIIVAEYYYEALRYSEALVYFKSIFTTFIKHGTSYKYFEHTVEVHKLIEHYFRSIEESQIKIEAHITMIKELRQACLKYYEESSAIVLSTTLVLATVCRRSSKHEFEAIELYEHIQKHSKSVTKEVRTSLQSLYYKRITTTTTKETTEMVEKAVTMTYERYTLIRQSHSVVDEKTLTILKQLIQLWHKQSKSDLIIKELRTVIIEIITKVKKSEELVETGKFLAEIFVSCGYQKHAFEFVHELRQQIIYKVVSKESKFNLTTVIRASLAFLASFEYYVRADWTLTLSVLMADIIAEYSYYHRFTESIKAKAKVETVIAHGARLRRILVRTHRVTDFVILENEMVKYFVSKETAVMKQCQPSAVRLFVVLLLKYCSTHQPSKTFTATAGHAAVAEVQLLLKQNKQKEAIELTRCTFYFLMAHEGLDDPTEITLGFRLCLLMGGRLTGQKASADMLEVSRKILTEIFTICDNFNINIARIPLNELNQLIEMIGEQKDYARLHSMLRTLWSSRESQTKWPKDAVLKLGMRLVQAEFAAGHHTSAVRLCENIVYNIRRVYGPRNQNTLKYYELLASLYTSIGMKHKNGSDKRDAELAKFYFKKAMSVQEESLRAFAGWDENEQDDDDEDLYSEYTGSVARGQDGTGNVSFDSQKEEIEAAARHLKKLHLSMQRLGGWNKSSSEFEKLTDNIWNSYGNDLNMKEDEVRSGHWKVEKLGDDVKYDAFEVPPSWGVLTPAA